MPQIIITSFLFANGKFSQSRLDDVLKALGGDTSKLVIDLSCRRSADQKWFVAMNKWQTITDMEVNLGKLVYISHSKYTALLSLMLDRLDQSTGALLLRVPDPRSGQRGVAERD